MNTSLESAFPDFALEGLGGGCVALVKRLPANRAIVIAHEESATVDLKDGDRIFVNLYRTEDWSDDAPPDAPCDSYDQVREAVARFELLVQAELATLGEPGTIGHLIAQKPLFASMSLHDDILKMGVETGCGEECVKVIEAGHTLAELSADVREDIIAAVERQLTIFYFG